VTDLSKDILDLFFPSVSVHSKEIPCLIPSVQLPTNVTLTPSFEGSRVMLAVLVVFSGSTGMVRERLNDAITHPPSVVQLVGCAFSCSNFS